MRARCLWAASMMTDGQSIRQAIGDVFIVGCLRLVRRQDAAITSVARHASRPSCPGLLVVTRARFRARRILENSRRYSSLAGHIEAP